MCVCVLICHLNDLYSFCILSCSIQYLLRCNIDPAAPDGSPGDRQQICVGSCWIIPAICHWMTLATWASHTQSISKYLKVKFFDIPPAKSQGLCSVSTPLWSHWKRADRRDRASRPASEVQFSSPPGCSLAHKATATDIGDEIKAQIGSHSSLKTQRPQLHRKRFSCRSLSPWRTSLPTMCQPTKLHNLSILHFSIYPHGSIKLSSQISQAILQTKWLIG